MPRRKKELLEDVTPDQSQVTNQPETQEQQTELQSEVAELVEPNFEPKLEQLPSPSTTTAPGSNATILEVSPELVESSPRDFLAASLESATASIQQLFATQAELNGSQVADAVFDKFEAAFINRLEERLTPFVDVVLPNIRETQTQLQQGSTTRLERRQGAFERLKQIASLISDECRLLPPVTAVGEFVTWNEIEPTQQQEND
jgi:hypothetical protein